MKPSSSDERSLGHMERRGIYCASCAPRLIRGGLIPRTKAPPHRITSASVLEITSGSPDRRLYQDPALTTKPAGGIVSPEKSRRLFSVRASTRRPSLGLVDPPPTDRCSRSRAPACCRQNGRGRSELMGTCQLLGIGRQHCCVPLPPLIPSEARVPQRNAAFSISRMTNHRDHPPLAEGSSAASGAV